MGAPETWAMRQSRLTTMETQRTVRLGDRP